MRVLESFWVIEAFEEGRADLTLLISMGSSDNDFSVCLSPLSETEVFVYLAEINSHAACQCCRLGYIRIKFPMQTRLLHVRTACSPSRKRIIVLDYY